MFPHTPDREGRRSCRSADATPRPLQTSLRYRWEDIFWFRFFHEAAHVLQHCKNRSLLEGLEVATDDESQVWEDEADRFAARILVPAEYESNLRRLT
jgi:HTH-type transcriptional regulator/antitoxin HigA